MDMKKIHYSKKRILYTICFAFLCIIDQRTKTGSRLDGIVESFRDATGIVMAVLILSHFGLDRIRQHRVVCVIWTILCGIGGALFLWKGQGIAWFLNDRAVLTADVWLWGIIAICSVRELFLPGRKFHRFFFGTWLLMMALMCASRNDSFWPFAYLVMFGCFYFTDYTAKEQEDMFHGMLDGLICGFFLMQGWTFVFRPYDTERYNGVYQNCNLNGLFYLMILAAVLTKLLTVYEAAGTAETVGNRTSETVRNRLCKLFYWAGVGALLGFVVLTVGRTACLVAVILVGITLLLFPRVLSEPKWIRSIIKNGLLTVAVFAVIFPLVFGAARYLPPLFHHPVWFWGEWREERVHSWDPWDSEKYTEITDVFGGISQRIVGFLLGDEEDAESEDVTIVSYDEGNGTASEAVPAPEETAVSQETAAPDGVAVSQEIAAPEETAAPEEAAVSPGVSLTAKVGDYTEEDMLRMGVTPEQRELYEAAWTTGYTLTDAERNDPRAIRKSIYLYYLHFLNWTGHPASEQGFQMWPDYRNGHAHDIYLQWGVDFGIPAMILFMILVLWTIIDLVRGSLKKNVQDVGCLLLFLVPCLFGILEFAWGEGSLTITMMFLIWRRVMRRESY